MHLHFVRPGDDDETKPATVPEADALVAWGEAPSERLPNTSLFIGIDAFSASEGEPCRTASQENARLEGRSVACLHEPVAQAALDERAKQAARLDAQGVLLDRPDAWYALGSGGAGYCDACNTRLNAHLTKLYDDQYVPYRVVDAIAAAGETLDGPFFREHAQVRLASGVEHGARLARRVRDEARLVRRTETMVGARLAGLNPAAVKLVQKLDFVVLPTTCDDFGQVDPAPYEIFAATLGKRPVIGVVDEETALQPARALQACRYATALGASVALPPSAPADTLEVVAEHRRFVRDFNSRYRPSERYSEVLLVYSPECDHWTNGRHGRGVRAAAEALSRVCAQYRIVLSVPRTGSEPLIVVDAGALPAAEARHLSARIRDGASALVVGRTGGADEKGRAFEPPLGGLSEGLSSVGHGTVFAIDPNGEPEQRPVEPLVLPMERALESILGRGRRTVQTNHPSLLVKLYLDPERKLDVHLVGRNWNAAAGSAEAVQGAVLRLSGAAVGGARMGWLFSQGAAERKVTLTPYNMGVQAKLPDFIGSAVLTIPR